LRKTTPILFVLFTAAFLLGATTATPPSSQKKKAAPRTSVVGKKAAPTTNSKKKATTVARRGAVRKPVVESWRNTQRLPTPDRYKEIQQALANKGYLDASAPSGVWDSSSVSALRKFQEDQSLEPSGKLDSLSIIALGLGPKHEQQPSAPPLEPRQ
jgi:peptidoglycan hydrolase-like protein with peptidoglycan-binding domain